MGIIPKWIRQPTKVTGWTMAFIGLMVLAQPLIPFLQGIISDTVSSATGIILIGVGLTIVSGLPSVNKIYNEVEYGAQATVFFVGLALLFIQMQGWASFKNKLLLYMTFGFVTGITTVFVNIWLSEE